MQARDLWRSQDLYKSLNTLANRSMTIVYPSVLSDMPFKDSSPCEVQPDAGKAQGETLVISPARDSIGVSVVT